MFKKAKKLYFRIETTLKYFSKIKLYKTILRKCSIDLGSTNNEVVFRNIEMLHSEIIIDGVDNLIVLKETSNRIYNLSIKIYGNNNSIEIGENAIIYGLRIVVRGNGCHVFIGRNFTENHDCMIVCMGTDNYVEIGDDCMFSSNIDIWNTDAHKIFNYKGEVINASLPIKIGNHVWIGKCSTILKGVSVGDDSIIGFGSVVTKSIEEKTIYVGNPAKKIKSDINWSHEFVNE